MKGCGDQEEDASKEAKADFCQLSGTYSCKLVLLLFIIISGSTTTESPPSFVQSNYGTWLGGRQILRIE